MYLQYQFFVIKPPIFKCSRLFHTRYILTMFIIGLFGVFAIEASNFSDGPVNSIQDKSGGLVFVFNSTSLSPKNDVQILSLSHGVRDMSAL